MRAWDELDEDLSAAGGRLYVLTADKPELLQELRPELPALTYVPVSAELWSELGLANRKKRGKVPHPSTLIVDDSGTLRFVETHLDYTQRTPPAEVIAWVTANAEAPQEATPDAHPTDHTPTPEGEATPDFERAVTLRAAPGALTLSIAPGFHLYGAKETVGRPVALRVEGQPELVTPIPDGDRKDLAGLGEAWVLTEELVLPLPEGAKAGEVAYQVCTESACSMPMTRAWVLE